MSREMTVEVHIVYAGHEVVAAILLDECALSHDSWLQDASVEVTECFNKALKRLVRRIRQERKNE